MSFPNPFAGIASHLFCRRLACAVNEVEDRLMKATVLSHSQARFAP
jgi:hypothetical protein